MFVDVMFPVSGDTLPVDNSYLLFSAVSKIVPEIHDNEQFGIFPVNGMLIGERRIRLTRNSRLGIRCPVEGIKSIYQLAGKTLQLQEDRIQLQIPVVQFLRPSPVLYSRLVVIKSHMSAESFLECAQNKLREMGLTQGKAFLIEQKRIQSANEGKKSGTHSPYLRRTVNIKGSEIVGFALRVENLTESESILLQEKGLGGRRHLGCGLFIPFHEKKGSKK